MHNASSRSSGYRVVVVLLAVLANEAAGINVAVNSWYVRLARPADAREAAEVATRNGFTYLGPLFSQNLSAEHHFMHKAVPQAATYRSVGQTRKLRSDDLVTFASQEVGFVRVKRGAAWIARHLMGRLVTGLSRPKKPTADAADKSWVAPSDSLYGKEWYLKNTGQAGGVPGLDLNVEAAWAKGYTGRNITTAVMDDGLDYLHSDLADNYNPEASYDVTSNDPYPYPRYTDDGFNSHGTRCAGEIAAARDGKKAVGVAYNSRIAGIRMLDQPFMNDLIEARSLGHRQDINDIYSASWGPRDNGQTVGGPRKLTMRALVKGINKGRQGKGNIYVWASGNGGEMDDCNVDGFAVSMWTLSINSVTNDGQVATYDESCSSTLASTFSNGNYAYEDAGVATTDLYDRVTTRHSGTSAAAPEAAGVFALALEANRNVTWRDMQHLVVLTSKQRQLHDSKDEHPWKMNGAGLLFNHLFGFGVLDAGEIVDLASTWKPLPDRYHCDTKYEAVNRTFNVSNPLKMVVNFSGCAGERNEINFLEHAQAFITVKASRRGDINIFLTSPMNTRSILLKRRPLDADSRVGLQRWPFMTTQTWAENPRGQWTLEVTVAADAGSATTGVLEEFKLSMHGTGQRLYANQDDKSGAHRKLAAVKKAHEGPLFRKAGSSE